jgi:hypothetical protein
MSNKAASFTAESAFVESGVPYDTSFLDRVKTGFHCQGAFAVIAPTFTLKHMLLLV